jgi:hypothetical protein
MCSTPQLLSTAFFLGHRASGRKIARRPSTARIAPPESYSPAIADVNDYLFRFALFVFVMRRLIASLFEARSSRNQYLTCSEYFDFL